MNLRLDDAPDLARVAALMEEVWPRPCWRYTESLLASYLHRVPERGASIGCFVGDDLVGFIGAVPFQGLLEGAPMQGAFTSFYTVHPRASMHGASPRLLSALAERLRAQGCGFYVTLIDANQPSRPLIEMLHRRAGIVLQPVTRIGFWIGALPSMRNPKPGAVRAAPYEGSLLAPCQALLRTVAGRHGLMQQPGDALLDAMLRGDVHGTSRVWVDHGKVRALALFRPRDVIDQVPRRNLHVDWLLFDPSTDAESRACFLESALHEIASEGIHLIVVPIGGDGDVETFRTLGFLRGKRAMQLYVANLADPKAVVKPFQSAWLEVF